MPSPRALIAALQAAALMHLWPSPRNPPCHSATPVHCACCALLSPLSLTTSSSSSLPELDFLVAYELALPWISTDQLFLSSFSWLWTSCFLAVASCQFASTAAVLLKPSCTFWKWHTAVEQCSSRRE
jgi:hypothetical protein